jgi:mannitol-1-/sugar-/sorbitol-6-/2-deoxyglucose-6-phosphatase
VTSAVPARPARSRATGAVFDMDGLLIDSEPIWREVHREVFAELGVDLARWPGIVTTGMRVDEVVAMRRTAQDWGDVADDVVIERITRRVAERIVGRAEILPGAVEAIEWCRERGLSVGLATGSTWTVLDVVLENFPLAGSLDAVVSAEDEPFGKPHPAVFLTAATKLGVHPADCLAFEDSLNGVIAAKSARMRVVAVPAGTSIGDGRLVLADVLLDSLAEIDDGRVAELAGFVS